MFGHKCCLELISLGPAHKGQAGVKCEGECCLGLACCISCNGGGWVKRCA